ncbi:MAG: hypothetical protein LBF33_00120 [Oscillospiraceae bacterium]|nr:hypothetical protein [Oscillospiraceae bacterium]
MYINLEIELTKKNINKVKLAKITKINKNCLYAKIANKINFRLKEAIKIKEILGTDMSLEELFRWEEPEGEREVK